MLFRSPMSAKLLESLMRPRSIAVIGASPRAGSVGNSIVRSLVDFGFSGNIHPIHPSAAEVYGMSCFSDISDVPEEIDCVAVALSAEKTIPALQKAAEFGAKSAVVFASGFAEKGEAGARLQNDLYEMSLDTGLAICGPNCLGLANITERTALYSAPLPVSIKSGGVAILSHSGSGCIALSNLNRFGLSYIVSSGNSAVLDIADYLQFLAEDETTKVAALFAETIRNPTKFADAAQAMLEAGKPVVCLKIGHSKMGASATSAHTGSLAVSEEVCKDFFARNGVIAVDDIDELVECISLMSSVKRRPKGSGLGVMTVSGGQNALICDIAERVNVDLPTLNTADRKSVV